MRMSQGLLIPSINNDSDLPSMATRWSDLFTAGVAEVLGEVPERFLRRDLHVPVLRSVMSADGFPEQTVRSGRFGDLQSIDLDVCKRICFL